MGGVNLHGGTDDQIMTRERGSFTNAFFSNLNTVNLGIFPDHVKAVAQRCSVKKMFLEISCFFS